MPEKQNTTIPKSIQDGSKNLPVRTIPITFQGEPCPPGILHLVYLVFAEPPQRAARDGKAGAA